MNVETETLLFWSMISLSLQKIDHFVKCMGLPPMLFTEFFYLTPLIRLSYRGLTSLSPCITLTLSAKRGGVRQPVMNCADYEVEITSFF